MNEELERYQAAKKALDEKANQIRHEALVRFYQEQGHRMLDAVEIADRLMEEVW